MIFQCGRAAVVRLSVDFFENTVEGLNYVIEDIRYSKGILKKKVKKFPKIEYMSIFEGNHLKQTNLVKISSNV